LIFTAVVTVKGVGAKKDARANAPMDSRRFIFYKDTRATAPLDSRLN